MIFLKKYKHYIALLIIVVLGVIVFLPQLESLKQSLQALQSANIVWVLVASMVFFSGVIVLTLQYIVLALHKLAFYLTLQVECAELFVSRILPSGVGTVALNMYYLMQKKHTAAQATAVVAANGFSNLIAYSTLVIIGLLSSDFTLGVHHSISDDVHARELLIPLLVLFIIGAVLHWVPSIQVKTRQFITTLLANIKKYKSKPKAVTAAIILNGLGSLTGIVAIYFTAKALSIDLSFAQSLLIYTAGNIMASLVPTPGGLGSAEAGIYAGLTISGVSTVDAISVTMLYRLISYWVPLFVGYIAFWHLRKTVLSDFSLKHAHTT